MLSPIRATLERLELSGREQFQLADEIADDMTGYGPLRPLLLDESINDIMVNGPSAARWITFLALADSGIRGIPTRPRFVLIIERGNPIQ